MKRNWGFLENLHSVIVSNSMYRVRPHLLRAHYTPLIKNVRTIHMLKSSSAKDT